MAYLYGGGIGDFLVSPQGDETLDLVENTPVWFYNSQTGGTRYGTDTLTDLGGAPIDQVTSDSTGAIPQFYSTVPTGMWADANAGAGPRRFMQPADLASTVATQGTAVSAATSAAAAAQAAVGGLAAVATSGAYGDLTGRPVLAAVATTGAYADVVGAPPPGMQVVVKVGGSWPPRASSAPDATRLANWIGPAPAPSTGAGGAIAGDLWTPTP
jgi:hypothetical protein